MDFTSAKNLMATDEQVYESDLSDNEPQSPFSMEGLCESLSLAEEEPSGESLGSTDSWSSPNASDSDSQPSQHSQNRRWRPADFPKLERQDATVGTEPQEGTTQNTFTSNGS